MPGCLKEESHKLACVLSGATDRTQSLLVHKMAQKSRLLEVETGLSVSRTGLEHCTARCLRAGGRADCNQGVSRGSAPETGMGMTEGHGCPCLTEQWSWGDTSAMREEAIGNSMAAYLRSFRAKGTQPLGCLFVSWSQRPELGPTRGTFFPCPELMEDTICTCVLPEVPHSQTQMPFPL